MIFKGRWIIFTMKYPAQPFLLRFFFSPAYQTEAPKIRPQPKPWTQRGFRVRVKNLLVEGNWPRKRFQVNMGCGFQLHFHETWNITTITHSSSHVTIRSHNTNGDGNLVFRKSNNYKNKHLTSTKREWNDWKTRRLKSSGFSCSNVADMGGRGRGGTLSLKVFVSTRLCGLFS